MYMKKIWTAFVFVVTALAAQAQEQYDVRLIPPDLLKNANAVKRLEEEVFRIESLDKSVYRYKIAYTIFNDQADNLATLAEGYDKFTRINDFDATLYNALGKKLRSVKKSEVKDESAVSDISLMEDNRVKWFSFYHKEYPYTVEFEVETEMSNTMFFPNWCPVSQDRLSVQQSSFSVVCDEQYSIRYKLLSGIGEPEMRTEKGKKVYQWKLNHFKALYKEPYAMSWYTIAPTVIIAPKKFRVQDYEGDMSDWENFGKFSNVLKEGRDKLPDNLKLQVKKLTENASTDREKIAVLYNYMQKNMRYISIQLGIGGWQPFEASFVAEKKYGDCKALSNFMYAMLKEAGIESYYTLIRAGAEPNAKFFLPDFSKNQFNHAILCVPNKGDTVWLECTSSTLQPGYLSDFTDNRYACLITPAGGKLVRTPKYGIKENLQRRNIQATLDASGNLLVKSSTQYRALQQDALHGMLHGLSKEKIMEVLKNQLELATYDVTAFQYEEDHAALPSVFEKLDIESPAYAQVSGKRVFIMPNIMTRSAFKPVADTARKYPIYFDYAYRDVDTAEITIPEGYVVEAMPKETVVESAFGKFKASVKLEGNKMTYYRDMERASGTFEPSAYPEMVKFYETIYKADRAKVVLVKKTE